MVAVSTVSPGEVMQWNGQRADARQNLLSQKAGNLYQQQLNGLQYGQQRANMGRKFDQARVQLPTSFAQRGLLRSGLYQNALSQYAQERLAAQSGLQTAFMQAQGGHVLADRGYEDDYASALQRILGETYARQAQQAAQFGGF